MQFLLAKACSPEWCNYTITKINGTEYNLSLNCNETIDKFKLPDTNLTIVELEIVKCMKTLPLNLCKFNKIKTLRLYMNSLNNMASMNFTCLNNTLTKFYLSNNSIELIDNNTFYGLNRVIVLDLGYNKLKNINNDMLKSLKKLQTLDVSENNLTEIKKGERKINSFGYDCLHSLFG